MDPFLGWLVVTVARIVGPVHLDTLGELTLLKGDETSAVVLTEIWGCWTLLCLPAICKAGFLLVGKACSLFLPALAGWLVPESATVDNPSPSSHNASQNMAMAGSYQPSRLRPGTKPPGAGYVSVRKVEANPPTPHPKGLVSADRRSRSTFATVDRSSDARASWPMSSGSIVRANESMPSSTRVSTESQVVGVARSAVEVSAVPDGHQDFQHRLKSAFLRRGRRSVRNVRFAPYSTVVFFERHEVEFKASADEAHRAVDSEMTLAPAVSTETPSAPITDMGTPLAPSVQMDMSEPTSISSVPSGTEEVDVTMAGSENLSLDDSRESERMEDLLLEAPLAMSDHPMVDQASGPVQLGDVDLIPSEDGLYDSTTPMELDAEPPSRELAVASALALYRDCSDEWSWDEDSRMSDVFTTAFVPSPRLEPAELDVTMICEREIEEFLMDELSSRFARLSLYQVDDVDEHMTTTAVEDMAFQIDDDLLPANVGYMDPAHGYDYGVTELTVPESAPIDTYVPDVAPFINIPEPAETSWMHQSQTSFEGAPFEADLYDDLTEIYDTLHYDGEVLESQPAPVVLEAPPPQQEEAVIEAGLENTNLFDLDNQEAQTWETDAGELEALVLAAYAADEAPPSIEEPPSTFLASTSASNTENQVSDVLPTPTTNFVSDSLLSLADGEDSSEEEGKRDDAATIAARPKLAPRTRQRPLKTMRSSVPQEKQASLEQVASDKPVERVEEAKVDASSQAGETVPSAVPALPPSRSIAETPAQLPLEPQEITATTSSETLPAAGRTEPHVEPISMGGLTLPGGNMQRPAAPPVSTPSKATPMPLGHLTPEQQKQAQMEKMQRQAKALMNRKKPSIFLSKKNTSPSTKYGTRAPGSADIERELLSGRRLEDLNASERRSREDSVGASPRV
ncbi:hypothetical protein CDD82_2986 [Ophiocordyceps australis]|uniref:Uncharacterized protein n=1 Tax=Ophiocordyceps australis TaxID=1399860 RepID=A0A2C5ZUT6_9HYPO|nr:hypothetical protein CDD82_2986 [Ophiocordyceps australis]